MSTFARAVRTRAKFAFMSAIFAHWCPLKSLIVAYAGGVDAHEDSAAAETAEIIPHHQWIGRQRIALNGGSK
jgi:hypothetical protein